MRVPNLPSARGPGSLAVRMHAHPQVAQAITTCLAHTAVFLVPPALRPRSGYMYVGLDLLYLFTQGMTAPAGHGIRFYVLAPQPL